MTFRAKFIFYVLLVTLIAGLVGVGYLIVNPFGSQVTQSALEQISKSVIEKGISSSTRTELFSSKSGESTWPGVGTKAARAESELKFSAEVQSRLDVLKSLFSQGRTDEALRLALELRAEFPHEPAFKAVGSDLLFAKGEYSEAADLLADVILDNPKNFALKVRHAEALDLAGRNEEAYDSLSNTLSEDPTNGKAMLALLKQGEVLDRRRDVHAVLEGAFNRMPSVDGALVLADAYFMEGDAARGEEMKQRAQQIDRDHPLVNRIFAVDAAGRGDWKQAEEYLETAIAGSDNLNERALSIEAFIDVALFKGRKDLAIAWIPKMKEMGVSPGRIEQVEMRVELLDSVEKNRPTKN